MLCGSVWKILLHGFGPKKMEGKWLVGFLWRYGTTLIMYEDRHLGFLLVEDSFVSGLDFLITGNGQQVMEVLWLHG